MSTQRVATPRRSRGPFRECFGWRMAQRLGASTVSSVAGGYVVQVGVHASEYQRLGVRRVNARLQRRRGAIATCGRPLRAGLEQTALCEFVGSASPRQAVQTDGVPARRSRSPLVPGWRRSNVAG
jgi:hypothetical protein